MKDEIKEILDKLKDCVNNPIDIEVDQFTQESYHIPNYFCLNATTNDCKLLLDYITNLQQKEMIMKRYLELVVDLGYDYDGFNKVDSLKELIDELVRYANLGRTCDTTEPIYEKDDRKYNILDEELKDK